MDIMGMILWTYDIFDYHYYNIRKKMTTIWKFVSVIPIWMFVSAILLLICGIYFDKLDKKENEDEK